MRTACTGGTGLQALGKHMSAARSSPDLTKPEARTRTCRGPAPRRAAAPQQAGQTAAPAPCQNFALFIFSNLHSLSSHGMLRTRTACAATPPPPTSQTTTDAGARTRQRTGRHADRGSTVHRVG